MNTIEKTSEYQLNEIEILCDAYFSTRKAFDNYAHKYDSDYFRGCRDMCSSFLADLLELNRKIRESVDKEKLNEGK